MVLQHPETPHQKHTCFAFAHLEHSHWPQKDISPVDAGAVFSAIELLITD